MNLRYRIMQLMYGRYGTDRLFYLLFSVAVFLSVINIFLRSVILQLIIYALSIFAIYRVFSRNTERRRKENAFFTEKAGFIKRKKEFYDRRRADKCHVYKKCPFCCAILRLPKRPGKHSTVCPKCGKEFTVRVRK